MTNTINEDGHEKTIFNRFVSDGNVAALPGGVVGDLQYENSVIIREIFFDEAVEQTFLAIPIGYFTTIEDYNPEWVSIDIRGQNVEVSGEITHVLPA